MQVALILPIDCLSLAEEYNTGYHLILPQLLQQSEVYRKFYTQIEGYKILDNGAAEGVDIYHVDLHDLAGGVGANEIVIPDVLGDCDATISKVRAFQRWARPDQYDYAGVVQGSSMAEVVKCLNFYDGEPWIKNVHIPRILNRTIHRAFRFTFLDALFGQTGSKFAYRFDRMHCLGASEWVKEPAALSTVPIIRGMDTSLVASMSIAGRDLEEEYVQRQPEFFDLKVNRNSPTWGLLSDNIRQYLAFAGSSYTQTPSSEV